MACVVCLFKTLYQKQYNTKQDPLHSHTHFLTRGWTTLASFASCPSNMGPPLFPQVVKRSYGKAFKLSISTLFVTPKTAGAQVVLSEQELLLWPSDLDKPSASEGLPPGSRAHVTLGCAADVQPVQTGLDLLEILQQVKGGSQGEEVGELSRGKLYSLGKGRWMLNLAKKMEVKAIFTGYYGKGKPVPVHGSRKGGAMQICTII